MSFSYNINDKYKESNLKTISQENNKEDKVKSNSNLLLMEDNVSLPDSNKDTNYLININSIRKKENSKLNKINKTSSNSINNKLDSNKSTTKDEGALTTKNNKINNANTSENNKSIKDFYAKHIRYKDNNIVNNNEFYNNKPNNSINKNLISDNKNKYLINNKNKNKESKFNKNSYRHKARHNEMNIKLPDLKRFYRGEINNLLFQDFLKDKIESTRASEEYTTFKLKLNQLKLQINSILQSVIAFISIIIAVFRLTVIENKESISGSNNLDPKTPALSATIYIEVSTLLLIIMLVFEYYIYSEMHSILVKKPSSLWRKEKRHLFVLISSIVLVVIHPMPFLENVTVKYWVNGYNTYVFYYLNDILSIFLPLRILFVFKVILYSSKYYSARVGRLAKFKGVNLNLLFPFKCLMTKRPYTFYPIVLSMTILFTTYGLMVGEIPLDRLTFTNYSNWWNSLWCIIITITTVGFGDLFARSLIGRIMLIIAAILGNFLFSMLVSNLENIFYFSYDNKRICLLLDRMDLTHNNEKEAKYLLSNYFKIRKIIKNERLKNLKDVNQEDIKAIDNSNNEYNFLDISIKYFKNNVVSKRALFTNNSCKIINSMSNTSKSKYYNNKSDINNNLFKLNTNTLTKSKSCTGLNIGYLKKSKNIKKKDKNKLGLIGLNQYKSNNDVYNLRKIKHLKNQISLKMYDFKVHKDNIKLSIYDESVDSYITDLSKDMELRLIDLFNKYSSIEERLNKLSKKSNNNSNDFNYNYKNKNKNKLNITKNNKALNKNTGLQDKKYKKNKICEKLT